MQLLAGSLQFGPQFLGFLAQGRFLVARGGVLLAALRKPGIEIRGALSGRFAFADSLLQQRTGFRELGRDRFGLLVGGFPVLG